MCPLRDMHTTNVFVSEYTADLNKIWYWWVTN